MILYTGFILSYPTGAQNLVFNNKTCTILFIVICRTCLRLELFGFHVWDIDRSTYFLLFFLLVHMHKGKRNVFSDDNDQV